MKLVEKKPRIKLINSFTVLGEREAAEKPLADFERLFTTEERERLEMIFLLSVQKLENLCLDRVDDIELNVIKERAEVVRQLQALTILDQALQVPLIGLQLRERAKAAIQKTLRVQKQPLTIPVILSEFKLLVKEHPELLDTAGITDAVCDQLLDQLATSGSVGYDTVIALLLLRPDKSSTIDTLPGADEVYRVWHSKEATMFSTYEFYLYRLLHPEEKLEPGDRRRFFEYIQQRVDDPGKTGFFTATIHDYARLAVVFAPTPAIQAHAKIDLGMPAKQFYHSPDLPDRPL